MKKVIQVLSMAALMGVSFGVSAKVIKVSYEGIVTLGDSNIGAPAAVGSSISGSLFINTDDAPAAFPFGPGVDYSNGFGGGDDSNFVTGFSPVNLDSLDFLYLEDNGATGDYFELADWEIDEFVDAATGNTIGTDYFLYLSAESFSIDFISGFGLDQTFSLSGTDLTGFGELYGVPYYEYDAGGNLVGESFEYVEFDLTSFSAAEVPVPGVLALFSVGLAGLGLSRRASRQKTLASAF